MSYKVYAAGKTPFYFATENEARIFVNVIQRKTSLILTIVKSKHKVTHFIKEKWNGNKPLNVKATIKYCMKETHPDMKYVKDWNPLKTYEYSDTYRFEPEYYDRWKEQEEREAYMKSDLALVAGGGYNKDHIWNVEYQFEIVKEESEA